MTDANTTAQSTAIALVGQNRATLMRAAIDETKAQRAFLKEFIDSEMVEGTDYGKIPGTDDRSLLKPGAEKLVDIHRAEPDFEIVDRIVDWDRPLFYYEIKCTLRDSDRRVLAVGMGSCSSRESKYRYRYTKKVCPKCQAEALIVSKFGNVGWWFCFPKRGGCGSEWEPEDERITSQVIGKVENPDAADSANTILKMAKKRALVDGAIALARCSDLFTQDVEDMAPEDVSRGGGRGREDDREPRDPQRSDSRSSKPKQQRQEGSATFGNKLDWVGKDDWAGKPLMTASLTVLTEYVEALQAQHKGLTDKKQRDACHAQIKNVELAISIKEGESEEWGMADADREDPDPAHEST